jgi:hypothetical protein
VHVIFPAIFHIECITVIGNGEPEDATILRCLSTDIRKMQMYYGFWWSIFGNANGFQNTKPEFSGFQRLSQFPTPESGVGYRSRKTISKRKTDLAAACYISFSPPSASCLPPPVQRLLLYNGVRSNPGGEEL